MTAVQRATHVLLVALTTLGLLAGALGYAAAAWAHAARIAGDPVDNAELAQPPAVVTATFNEPMQAQFAAMTVIGPDGVQWAEGAPIVDGTVISVPVRPGGPAGDYTVNYRATSADGRVGDRCVVLPRTGGGPHAPGRLVGDAPDDHGGRPCRRRALGR
ncbi:copper resistance CopC family protein, partial [Mycolicibacterium vanbaalenii]|uniref:copper resistance CopC family protein n=1 Tax=Mycolicibacterium vanbaalenii TaxID=110539 RepID=UPI0039089915